MEIKQFTNKNKPQSEGLQSRSKRGFSEVYKHGHGKVYKADRSEDL